jgi:chromosome partitioning protein
LNAVPPIASHILADARAAVSVHGLEVAPVSLRPRAAYVHALTAGQTAQEYEPQGKAAEEMTKLYRWLRRTLQALS